MSKSDIIVDIGSKFLGFGLVNRDFVLREPCVVAEDALNKGVFLASGIKALQLFEDSDNTINLVFPIENGIVISEAAFKYLAENAMQKILPSGAFVGATKIWCVVKCGTDNDAKTVIDRCFNELGVKKVEFIPSSVADSRVAFGQFGCASCITVNIGHNITEVCAVSNDKVICGASMLWAGSNLDKMIADFIKNKYEVVVSDGDAKAVKQNCCSLYPNNMSVFKLKGVNTTKNQEETIETSARELYDTVASFFDKILTVINSMFLSVPVSLAENLRQNGIVLSGGVSNVEGLEKYIYDRLKVTVRLLEEPDTTGVNGARLFVRSQLKK